MKTVNDVDADSYYCFDDSNRSIVIKRHDTPQPWINYLSNGRMHAFVSQACGGFAWWKSPVMYRLTRYRQHNLPIDSPGFYVYIKNENGAVWSPGFRPCEVKLDSWQAVHQPGVTSFHAEYDGVKAVLSFFVSQTDDVLIWKLDLNSTDGRARKLDVYAYTEFSQLSWKNEDLYGYYDRLQLKTWYDENASCINYLFHSGNYPAGHEVPLAFFAGSEPVVSYSGNRNTFIGNYGSEAMPKGVCADRLLNDTISCGEPAAALHNQVVLNADGSTKELCFYLGAQQDPINNLEECENSRNAVLDKLRCAGETSRQLSKVQQWWEHHLSALQCEIPDAAGMRQINTFSVMNSVVTGRYSRSLNIDAPGVRGVGFRDTCQDMLAICYRDPAWAIDTLKFLMSLQYADGHALHMAYRHEWFEPATSVHCDDHLWLVYLVYAILAETGDLSLLEEPVPYYGEEKQTATVWQHLQKALDFTSGNLGRHGLPIILRSDWNDIIGKFNQRGEGESVFAGQQYVYALRQMIELAQATGRDASELQSRLATMEKAILENAWDGKWWRRAFDDNGDAVGSDKCKFGKIFLNTQSWALISATGTTEQNTQAMQSAEAQLATDIGLKLLNPSFAGWNSEEGKTPVGYGAGCGENGAIFCHSNTWAVIAQALLGNGEKAWKYFSQLIPHNIISKIGIDCYKAEPYAWVSNIVGPENTQFGWGNVSQISGTAPWMDVAATQYILGIRPQLDGLLISPCAPEQWTEFSIRRRYRGCDLQIKIKQSGNGGTVKTFTIDGKPAALDSNGKAKVPAELTHNATKLVIDIALG